MSNGDLAVRTLTVGGTDLTHFVHDRFGNVIAESNGTGPSGTLREYIWLPEAEIAPMFKSRAQVDRPLAVVEDVLTGTPVTWLVHVDHLNRPVRMTAAAKVVVWDAAWTPWGMPHSITGTGANTKRGSFACPPPAGRPAVPAHAPDAVLASEGAS